MVAAPESAPDTTAALKTEAKQLMAQRELMEQDLAVAIARLEASGAGLHGSLLDREVPAACPQCLLDFSS